MREAAFRRDGWTVFAPDPEVLHWLKTAGPAALACRRDRAQVEAWLRCRGTWFVGVNALDNDGAGRVAGSRPLGGAAIRFVRECLGFGSGDLDRAQVSICTPGYPKQDAGESDTAFAFRRDRDAAHIDGLHPVGPEKRRKLLEFHHFLLGIPVTETDERAAPLVVWQGSHRVLGAALKRALQGCAPEDWPEIDLTEVYRKTRQTVFETCPRVPLHTPPGGAVVLHHLALHGIAPWAPDATAPPEGRAILYFRPETAHRDRFFSV